MLLSELKLNTQNGKFNGQPIKNQIVEYECDECKKMYKVGYQKANEYNKIYKQDLCASCKLKHPLNINFRKVQKDKITKRNKSNNGKSYEELYGAVKAKKLIDNMKNPLRERKGFTEENIQAWVKAGHKASIKKCKGKTLEELHGKERAEEIKNKISITSSGSNNPMYGKPSPTGSGNGWSGWYKGWYFRSITELSYMINVIEKNNYSWIDAEKKRYKIPYIKEGRERNYFGDFIINDEEFIEIKPRNLRNSEDVLLKEEAAIEWCKKHELTYNIICNDEFDKLSDKEIRSLHDTGKIKFIDRYEEKYKIWQKQN